MKMFALFGKADPGSHYTYVESNEANLWSLMAALDRGLELMINYGQSTIENRDTIY